MAWACSTLPGNELEKLEFPKGDAFIGVPSRPFRVLGRVRTEVSYRSLDTKNDEAALCNHHFNKAAHDLVRRAKAVGADAVVDVQSVVFLFDGRMETFPNAQCSDEGDEGQVLAQGVAVIWLKPGEVAPTGQGPSPAPDVGSGLGTTGPGEGGVPAPRAEPSPAPAPRFQSRRKGPDPSQVRRPLPSVPRPDQPVSTDR